ncbi:hypothetical protein [Lentzea jiangxiensis]|uniref:Excreted virulence factor EspC, type VII ESX diderm n=1 Tax=Lentzea jiangxiensis TaxID=641025 RepID=A0A1H0J7P2_9PSEU|nr:hypothetical protein [Lentzea jiangxiensis]SDO39755.1 hypothetical protein SAMN05421507_102401 [Lentzea jiangxiensis]
MGDGFTTQLENLDKAATVLEQRMAGGMEATRRSLTSAVEIEFKAFDTADQCVYHLFSRLGREFRETADFMQQVLEDNRDNLVLAAQAVREIAHRYREADGQA